MIHGCVLRKRPFIIRASVKFEVKKNTVCVYARVCCVRVCMRVCREVVSLSRVFIPSGIEAQFQTSLHAVHIPLDCFLLRTFSPFQSSPQFENRKCTCSMLRERRRTLWFFPDFTSVEECVWGWTFETPAEGTQKGEVRVVAFAGEPWDLFTVPCLQGWPSETIDFSPGCFSLLLLGTFKTF